MAGDSADGALRHSDESWALGQGEVDGRPLFARWDLDARSQAPLAGHPVKITIGVQFRAPRPDGLPSDEDFDDLDPIEEALYDELASAGDARVVLVLSGNGSREWIAYAPDHEWVGTWGRSFAERFCDGRHHLVEAEMDPDWATFFEWVPEPDED